MLSYLLLYNKRLEFDFFLISIQNSHGQGQANSLAKILLINLLFKSNNKLVVHKPVNFTADPYDFWDKS